MRQAYVRQDQVLAKPAAGGSVLLDMRTGVLFNLNETGTRVWSLLAEAATSERIADCLATEHATIPRALIERDVGVLIEELATRELIVTSTGSRGGAKIG